MFQLNTPQALEAANRAGELNDQMMAQTQNSDDVSLASQEGLEIRGFFYWALRFYLFDSAGTLTCVVLINVLEMFFVKRLLHCV